ncbi:MAG: NUDIX hydrolase [Pseudomonadota bacterium]
MSMKETIRVGVGAVVFKGDEVLLVKRGRPPFKGHWSIPGGGLHYGERLEDGIAREVREETGVEIEMLGLISVFEALPEDTGQLGHTIMVDYAAEWRAGDVIAGDDAAEAAFVPIAEARDRLEWDETRRALAMALGMRTPMETS